MSDLSIYEFIEARIDETEKATEGLHVETIMHLRRMFNAMYAVLDMHKQWPFLIQGPVEFEPAMTDDFHLHMNNIALKAKQNIDFLIHSTYVQRFGEEPPTTPMLRQLATVWASHSDFRDEWFFTKPEFDAAIGYVRQEEARERLGTVPAPD